MSEEYENFETAAVRIQTERGQREHSAPVYMTSSFVFEDAEQARAYFADDITGNVYSRFTNPNNREFEEKIARMEGADDAVSFSSGMAAVFNSLIAHLSAGDHILSCRALFGSTHSVFKKLFPRWNISHTYVDATAPLEEWESKIQENTKLLYLETPSNPGLELVDLELLGKLAQKHKLILAVDNCFATPYLQRPMEYGAHLSIHSATKFIDGQGRAIGGVTAGTKEMIKEVRFFARQTGPALSPFNGWLFSKSLETLALRMDKHCENALKLAERLEGHPELAQVRYPFLPSHPQFALAQKQMKAGGGIVTFEVTGGIERGQKFLDNIQMCSLSGNLGDSRTIVTHPASTTHAKLSEEERQAVGIQQGLVRCSVGLENIKDIIQDIEQALEKSKG